MERFGAMMNLFITVLVFAGICYALPTKESPPTLLQDGDSPDDSMSGTFEGDMVLTSLQEKAIWDDIEARKTGTLGRKRKLLADSNYYWPQAIVPYEIHPTYESSAGMRRRIHDAIKMWEDKTCIRFVQRSSSLQALLGHKDFVFIQPGHDCISNVGRKRGMQHINISSSLCSTGRVAHELGHTIGFVHEQSRPDRDLYVHINYDNVVSTQRRQFEKYSNSKVTTYRLPYDIGSIMHYKSTAFSKNRRLLRTITTDDPLVQKWMGQRTDVSFLDAKLANLAYRCNVACDVSLICLNGGYIGPDCTCECPVGLSGQNCDSPVISQGCGGTLTSQTGTIQTANYPNVYSPDTDCSWLIKAPEQSSIRLEILDFHVEEDSDCDIDFLEIKLNGTQQVGQKYCGEAWKGRALTYQSGGNLLIRFVSDFNTEEKGFRIAYQIL